MFYYSYYNGKGRGKLAETLGADDPFRMPPYEILERILAGGALPLIDSQQADIWRARGEVYEVRLAKRNFLVAVSRGTEEINVQEIRSSAYDRIDDRVAPREKGSELEAPAL